MALFLINTLPVIILLFIINIGNNEVKTQPLCWALPDFCLPSQQNLLCLIKDFPKYPNTAQIWQFSWALE